MRAIEKIENLVSDSFSEDISISLATPEKYPFTQEQAQEMARRLGTIYCIAHSANKKHICYNVHEAWRGIEVAEPV